MAKTLAEVVNKANQIASRSRPRGDGEAVKRFLVLKNGDSFRFRFRQELSEDSPGYDPERGTIEIATVHVSPYDWRKKARCTLEDERFGFKCFPHEMVVVEPKWNPKHHLVANVLVQEDDKWVPRVLDQKMTSAHTGLDIVNFAEEYGTLVDRDFRISRQGDGRSTNYSVIPLSEGDVPEEDATEELFNLGNIFKTVPYDQQQDFYMESSDDNASDDASGW